MASATIQGKTMDGWWADEKRTWAQYRDLTTKAKAAYKAIQTNKTRAGVNKANERWLSLSEQARTVLQEHKVASAVGYLLTYGCVMQVEVVCGTERNVCTLEELAVANGDDLELLLQLWGISTGKTLTVGGGAEPITTITRIA